MTTALLDTVPAAAAPSRLGRRVGTALSAIAALFLAADAGFKFFATPEAVAGTTQLGWQPHHLPILGAVAAVCLVLYLIPRTAPLGAVLWTGYFGGAIATHLRIENPLFTHTLFPIYVAAFVWGGLYLRGPRVRALLRPAR